jgi:hypothetical protein
VTDSPARRVRDCRLESQTAENPLGRWLLGSPAFPGKFDKSPRELHRCHIPWELRELTRSHPGIKNAGRRERSRRSRVS